MFSLQYEELAVALNCTSTHYAYTMVNDTLRWKPFIRIPISSTNTIVKGGRYHEIIYYLWLNRFHGIITRKTQK